MLTFYFDIFQLVIFNDATEGDNYGNMEKVDTKFLMNVGRIRVIFLNRFVSDLLVRSAFIDPVLVLFQLIETFPAYRCLKRWLKTYLVQS